MSKKKLITGVKPTGTVHIGNYFGAMKVVVDMQEKYDTAIFVADLHALTSVQNAAEMQRLTKELILDYLAIGLDLSQVTLFKQSDAPQVAELSWIFNCITTMPYLMRAHAFKDAEAKNKEINTGVFNYPILMAADILLPHAHIVPVGLDQKQHVEIARDTAEKFNRIFGEYFPLPEPLILEEVKTVPGIDGRKMSKSYNNIIPLFGEDDVLKKQVMSITTDSKGVADSKDPETCNVFALHKLFGTADELAALAKRYKEGGIGYKESKDLLLAKIIAFVTPMREKRKAFEKDFDTVAATINEHGARVSKQYEVHMQHVRKLIGVGTM